MDSVQDPLKMIGEMLVGRALPTVNPERVAPSSIYDLQYRIAVIASAFEIHAKQFALTARRIQSVRLKLLQFIACRPTLTQMVEEWSKIQYDAQLSLALSQRLRRGFLGDQMHDDVVSFLVARGELIRSSQYLVTSPEKHMLRGLHTANVENGLFSVERQVLARLSTIRITNSMLEGW